MNGPDVEGVLAGALSEWQIIGVRAEHDPSCDGDCIDRCPVQVQYEVSTDEAAAHVAAVLREQIAAAIEAEADRAHAAFASDEDDHLADMKNRLGVDLEPGHWNRHDDGCSMCGMAGAARIVRAAQVAPSRVPGEGS